MCAEEGGCALGGDVSLAFVVVVEVALAEGTADGAAREQRRRRRRAEARSMDGGDGCGRPRKRGGGDSLVAANACWRPAAASGVDARISHLLREPILFPEFEKRLEEER